MSQQYPQFGPGPYQPPPKKKHTLRNILIVVGGVFVLLMVIGALASPDTQNTASDQPTAVPTPSLGITADPPPVTPTNTPAPTKTPTAKPVVKTSPPPKPKPKPVTYEKVTAREWKLIAKDPDAHIGEYVVVYGEVTQFDAATGTDGFRADVDGVKHRPSYGYVSYPTNTVLTGDASILSDLVEGDLFTAKVQIAGSYSYDTQIGGSTTVPSLVVKSITVTGSTAD